MFTIENELLQIAVLAKGAELQRIFNKQTRLDYLWSGDAAFWAKKSPILFPIVGTLKDNTYYYQGRAYHLNRHGFARDKMFQLKQQQPDVLSFLLQSSEATLADFPFSFDLYVTYSLHENALQVVYRVDNTSPEEMYFSIGGHPAFRVPLSGDLNYGDYYLEFNEEETMPRWPISSEGLIQSEPQPLLRQTNLLPLTRELFYQDALVLKNPASSMVSLKTDRSPNGIDFDFGAFPYLGIWATKNADFVCIEPWCGIADSVKSSQELVNKEGICRLQRGETFERMWTATFF